jgi:hypothetical protein
MVLNTGAIRLLVLSCLFVGRMVALLFLNKAAQASRIPRDYLPQPLASFTAGRRDGGRPLARRRQLRRGSADIRPPGVITCRFQA